MNKKNITLSLSDNEIARLVNCLDRQKRHYQEMGLTPLANNLVAIMGEINRNWIVDED